MQGVVNIKKMKFEAYGDSVDQAFSQFNKNLINNQDPQISFRQDNVSFLTAFHTDL